MTARGRITKGWALHVGMGAILLGLGLPQAALAQPSAGYAPAPEHATAAVVRPLTVEPVQGYIGESFTLTADGLPANKPVQFFWATVDGIFDVRPYPETIEFYQRLFTEKRVPLGQAMTDGTGHVSAAYPVPDDYGETHDIFTVVDGEDVARGGFRILPDFSINNFEGPVGTPITISAKGIGSKNWESTWAVNYDNQYAGFISAVTTRGTAKATIRASGSVGKHTIDIWHAGQTVPYLNWEQSPQSYIPVFHYTYFVTPGGTAPAPRLEMPSAPPVQVDNSLHTTASQTATTGRATVSPSMGAVLTGAELRVTNLTPNKPATIYWMTARGSRTSGLGWGMAETSLGDLTTDGAGTLRLPFTVPDDLGGWHSIRVVQGDTLAAEAFYLVQPSLLDVTPAQVKLGESFEIHAKGVGWTELDNIYGVVYDNSYIGFVCGFNSNGDVTLNLRASGEPGVHLIDLYPAVYQGHGTPPWLYDTPMLTFGTDHPSLGFGYQLPAFRLAITVTE